MKNVLLIVVIVGCVAGCARQTIRVAPIAVPSARVSVTTSVQKGEHLGSWMFENIYGPSTVMGELWLGCAGYFVKSNRWPRTKEEVSEGFYLMQREAIHLSELEELVMYEQGEELIVEFSTASISKGRMRLKQPQTKRP